MDTYRERLQGADGEAHASVAYPHRCIGRCYKVCSRGVMHLRGVDEDGNLVPCSMDEDGDDDEEFLRKVMVVDAAGNCIGCGACARVCPKSCQTPVKASLLAVAA